MQINNQNLATSFSANKQNRFYRQASIFICVTMATAHTSAWLPKNRKLVLLTCVLPFLGDQRIKGFREKGDWKTVSL